jgi:hypothetical protein
MMITKRYDAETGIGKRWGSGKEKFGALRIGACRNGGRKRKRAA